MPVKQKRLVMLALGVALALVLVACGGDDDNPAAPPVGNVNVLNGPSTGGSALVVAISAYDSTGAEDLSLVYDDDLTVDCEETWTAQGTLCNVDGTADDKGMSHKLDTDSGATWENDDPGRSTGVLVIDACSDSSCTSVGFSQARVFQMFSDGETTHIRLAIHPETGDTPPDWNDAGWTVIGDGFAAVGGVSTRDEGLTVGNPAVIDVGSRQTRYLRVEARNDGTPVEDSYIELRSLKLF